jgi:hypothetical protein
MHIDRFGGLPRVGIGVIRRYCDVPLPAVIAPVYRRNDSPLLIY